ncbi:MAG: phosphatase PAP2 family protein [Gemmiger sp.]|nr:phosphatase PAP2 family protein [Gemmiger sp.]
MQAKDYQAITRWFNARPPAKQALGLAAKGSAGLVYLLYGGLVAGLFLAGDPRFWRVVAIPAVIFLAGTALRAAINRPRPYTALGFAPLFPKNATGKSMPSRHSFSAACIAVAAGYVAPPLGILGGALALCVGACRVLTGQHYPSDVVVGLVLGGGLALAGFYLL